MISQANAAHIQHLETFKSESLFGATITRLLSRERLPTVGCDHVRIPKGSALAPHIHEASESFIYILAGGAVVTLDGRQFPVRAGDTIYIPPGMSHGFSTPKTAVELLSVQSPPIYPEDSAPDIKFGPDE
jgi:mannose-6-phosphate isomerase-like protein (cupin superfamily)